MLTQKPFASIWAGLDYKNIARGHPLLSIPQSTLVLGLFSPLLELPNPLSEIRGGLPIGERWPAGMRPLRKKGTEGPVHVYRSSSAEVVVGPSYSWLRWYVLWGAAAAFRLLPINRNKTVYPPFRRGVCGGRVSSGAG